jgi:hypothetical protein
MRMTPHELAHAMEENLKAYKKLPQSERKRIAHENLVSSGLINEDGEFTDNYPYSREYYRKKNAVK